jgi:hypothetical protein
MHFLHGVCLPHGVFNELMNAATTEFSVGTPQRPRKMRYVSSKDGEQFYEYAKHGVWRVAPNGILDSAFSNVLTLDVALQVVRCRAIKLHARLFVKSAIPAKGASRLRALTLLRTRARL